VYDFVRYHIIKIVIFNFTTGAVLIESHCVLYVNQSWKEDENHLFHCPLLPCHVHEAEVN